MSLAGNWRDSIHYLGRGNYFWEVWRSSLKNERITIITKIHFQTPIYDKLFAFSVRPQDFFYLTEQFFFSFFEFVIIPKLFFSHFWWSGNITQMSLVIKGIKAPHLFFDYHHNCLHPWILKEQFLDSTTLLLASLVRRELKVKATWQTRRVWKNVCRIQNQTQSFYCYCRLWQ